MSAKFKSYGIYAMLCVTLLLVAGTAIYLSHSITTEQALRDDKNIIPLNGPWKFTVGDNLQYAQPNYNDSGWGNMDLTAPTGVHDDDVGLSGFIPGWVAKGHPKYSGYAWYRLKVPVDSLAASNLALVTPPAVEDAYQLYINGSLLASAGDFSGAAPVIYSIQPRMLLLPKSLKKEKYIIIAFRVWMSAASRGPDAGGIHIAPAIGAANHIDIKYRFQWEQTIKGYIVEVALPVMFVLLAATIFFFNKNNIPTRSCKWFITALILVGLVRLNQAVYFWFQVESGHQATIIGSVILRPLMFGAWLMAWWEWFDLHRPKWLPKVIAGLVLINIVTLWLGYSWTLNTIIHTHYQTIADDIRLLLLALMLFITYLGIRKQGLKAWLVIVAILLPMVALFPSEISALHLIPGIWFPYGVGVSRGQFFYAAFVLVMYVVLIPTNRREKSEANSI